MIDDTLPKLPDVTDVIHPDYKPPHLNFTPKTPRIVKKADDLLAANPGDPYEISDLMQKMLNLAKNGRRTQEIARILNMPVRQCASQLIEALRRSAALNPIEIHDHRTLMTEQYDALITVLTNRIEKGDKRAVRDLREVLSDKAKLLGLNRPVPQEVKQDVIVTTMTAEQRQQRIQELLELRKKVEAGEVCVEDN